MVNSISKLLLASSLTALCSAASEVVSLSDYSTVDLALFTGKDSKTTWSWRVLNDPVMGGLSTGSFNTDSNAGVGSFNGHVAIVPKLSAPGFSTLETTNGLGVFGYANDASGYTHLLITVKNHVAYNGWKVSVAADTINPQFKCHKADVTIPVSDSDFITIAVPFTDFSNNWSSYTGEPIKKCSEDSSVCLTETNLKHISQIGVWAEGIEGDFKLDMHSISAGKLKSTASLAVGGTAGNSVDLAVFDGKDKSTTWNWRVVNDPVMGGLSVATFNVANNAMHFNGTVAIVPSLKAPGFSNLETILNDHGLLTYANDASAFTHLLLSVKSKVAYNGFKISLAADTLIPQFFSYKADVSIPVSDDFITVYMPFNTFSNKWSAATGEATKKCSDDASVCLTAPHLKHISQIGIWAEGVAGDFDLEIQSITAGFAPSAALVADVPTPVCKAPVQKSLRYSMSLNDDALDEVPIPRTTGQSLGDAICCDARYADLAEPRFLFDQVKFLDSLSPKETIFYDSVCGVPLFKLVESRYTEFKSETTEHGWPSFRPEDVLDKLTVFPDGKVYSSCGTHLGSNLPEPRVPGGVTEDRYCLDLVCVSGSPVKSLRGVVLSW